MSTDKEQQKFQNILQELLAKPENKECADCHAKGPRWASVNLGVFICLNCAGIHRNLGTHISFVRSASLDKWKLEQVQKMQEVGNARAKEIYEANLPLHFHRPDTNDTVHLEQFIRAKYERKEFMARGQRYDTSTTSTTSVPQNRARAPSRGEAPSGNRPRAPSNSPPRGGQKNTGGKAPAVDLLGDFGGEAPRGQTDFFGSSQPNQNNAGFGAFGGGFSGAQSNPPPSNNNDPFAMFGAPNPPANQGGFGAPQQQNQGFGQNQGNLGGLGGLSGFQQQQQPQQPSPFAGLGMPQSKPNQNQGGFPF